MSTGRRTGKKKSGTKQKSASNAWLTPLIAVIVLIGLGAGAWLVLPKLFSKGGAAAANSQHVALLQDLYSKEIAQLEIRRSMTNAATAQSSLGAYQKALEAEIAASNNWLTFMQQNPADLATRNALREEIEKHKKDVFDLNVAIHQQYTPGSGTDIQGIETELQKIQELLNQYATSTKAVVHQTFELLGQAQQDEAATAAQRPAPSADARDELTEKLKAKFSATRARLEIRKTMVDAATARAGLERYRQAVEAEIAATNEWTTLLKSSSPDDATKTQLRNVLVQESMGLMALQREIDQASIGKPASYDQAIVDELRPLSELFDRLNQTAMAGNRAAEVLGSAMEAPANSPPVSMPTPNNSHPGSVTAPTQDTSTAASDPASSPPTEPPEWVEPSPTAFSQKHGDTVARIRLIGVPMNLATVAFPLLTQNLILPGSGKIEASGAFSQQAMFIELAPVKDLSLLIKQLEPLGKVLQTNEEKRVIVLWVNPELIKKASQFSLPQPRPFGGAGTPKPGQ